MIWNIKYITLPICVFMIFSNGIGQTIEKLELNRGVEAYNNGDYGTAQDKFEQAFEANNQYSGALYNAANSAYRSGDFEKATEYYEQYAGTLENKNDKAKAYHNLGNVFLKRFSGSSQNQNPEEQKKSSDYLKNSIEAYKNSLRNNPQDEDTRYNLSYALSKLKKQQQQESKNKSKDENKDNKEQDKNEENKENQDNKDSDKSEEEKEEEGDKEDKNKDKEGGEGDKKEEEGDKKEGEGEGEGDKEDKNKDKEGDKPKSEGKDKGEEKEIEGKMSKGQIKKDLDAVNEDEKNILLKIAKQKGKKKGDNNTKDW